MNRSTALCSASETDVLKVALEWLQAGHRVALGTVICTSGSAPRQTGSHIIVRVDGAFEGSVSAGCVESAVIETAQSVLEDGHHRTLTFGTTDESDLEVGLLCGGTISVFIEPIA